MKRLSFFLMAVWVVVGTGCGGSPGESEVEARGRIGMTCMDLTNPFFKLIANVMAEEAARHGYELTALSGELDPAKQNSQMTDFVAQGYDAIFLNPVDSKTAGQGVKAAHEAGIPVFTFDVQVSDEEAAELVVSHIGSDNYQGGRLAGESMMEALGNEGRVAIVSLPEVTSCILRVDGFRDALEKAESPIEIVTELSGRGSRDGGYAVTTDILQAHPEIDGIFAINDPSALGAHAAVAKVDRAGEITVVGFDASPAGKQAVYEGKLYDTPQQFPRKMARGTVDAFVRYLAGEEVEKKRLIPCSHYRREDAMDDPSRVEEQW